MIPTGGRPHFGRERNGCSAAGGFLKDPTQLEPQEPPVKTQKKEKKLKELFVQDLARLQGGSNEQKPPKCPEITTLACGEEPVGCSGC